MLNTDFVITNEVVTMGGFHQLRYWNGRGSFSPDIHHAYIYFTREKVEAALKRINDKGSFADCPNVGYMTQEDVNAKIIELTSFNAQVAKENQAKSEALAAERAAGPKPEVIKSYLEAWKAKAQDELDKWAINFGINPNFALEWVDAQFTHAATLTLAIKYIGIIEYHAEKGTPDAQVTQDIKESLKEQLIFNATQNTNHSTGQGKNLLDGALVAVQAEFLRWLKI